MKCKWKVEMTKPKKLKKKDIKRCKKLSLGEDGLLLEYLEEELYRPKSKAQIGLVRSEGKIIGWSLLCGGDLHLFVDKDYRRKGIGKRLVKKTLANKTKHHKKIGVYNKSGGQARKKVFRKALKQGLVFTC